MSRLGPTDIAASVVEEPPPPPLLPPPVRWRKVLYARQPFADSHTGESFLEDLVVNAGVAQRRRYPAVVWAALALDQQLCTVAAVGSATYHLYQASALAAAVGLLS